ncbi:MAG: EthD family reductase, partial [Dehalococcoidia bacterium]|nr:EthD family reductase [Dehalococcoidia bacterium]
MVKLIYCIARKPGMPVEEFQRYWRQTHGPIAGRIPGLRRYVQCHTLPELYRREDAPAFLVLVHVKENPGDLLALGRRQRGARADHVLRIVVA